MVNSSNKAKKGQVTVRLDSGSIKACFPRNYFADGKQIKLGTGINVNNSEAIAAKLQRRLQLELEEGKLSTSEGIFNLGRYQEILEEYGLRARLKLVRITSDIPPKPEMTLLEIWDMYCEYRKYDLKESTYKTVFCRTYRNFIRSAIDATQSEDAIKIRNWLIDNRCFQKVKVIISYLEKAYNLAIRQNLITNNPYVGLTEDIKVQGCKGVKTVIINNSENDEDVLDKTKAYSWNEVQEILEYVRKNGRISHWYNFIKFKFISGTRTGEAIALMWGDVRWDKEQIWIRRSYSEDTRSFYNLKNAKGTQELTRIFPMPKNGELWNLLKSIPEGKPNEVVFKSKFGKIIADSSFSRAWRGRENSIKGIVPALIEQGKLTKYLPPYNTRHTFITHQIYDLGRDPKVVAAWCGHHENISEKHYQDIENIASQINPDTSMVNKSELDELKQQLLEQQELINKLMSRE